MWLAIVDIRMNNIANLKIVLVKKSTNAKGRISLLPRITLLNGIDKRIKWSIFILIGSFCKILISTRLHRFSNVNSNADKDYQIEKKRKVS